jgi:hypothetical protein
MASALTVLLTMWAAASSEVRAERIVLKSGEVIEGSIVDATRNTVIIRRSIGGMRQMRIQDIEEVRLDLAPGREIAGQFLSWADGVYEVREGDQIVRVSESGILSREPRQEAERQLARRPPSRPTGQQTVTAIAAPPAPTAGQTAAQESEGQNQSEAAVAAETQTADEVETQTATDAETQTAGDAERQTAGDAERQTADEAETEPGGAVSSAAGDAESQAGDTDSQALAKAESRDAAGAESAAVGDQGSPAVKASVDPPEPGARSMVFKIELSRPAAQTVVLIYGTVDGTAKAGEDYEPQQGMVTLTPGAKSAEVRVPLIADRPENGDKRFELVLMADPKVADVVDRRVIATIKGTD